MGYVINSKAVDNVIGSESLTPARVSQPDHRYEHVVADNVTECIYYGPLPVWAKIFLPLCCGPHA